MNRMPTCLIGLFFAVSSSVAIADNRFGDGRGAAVGGDGSFASGRVEVYHNFEPSDEQQLQQRISALEEAIQAKKNEIAAFESEATRLEAEYTRVINQVNAKRRQYGT